MEFLSWHYMLTLLLDLQLEMIVRLEHFEPASDHSTEALCSIAAVNQICKIHNIYTIWHLVAFLNHYIITEKYWFFQLITVLHISNMWWRKYVLTWLDDSSTDVALCWVLELVLTGGETKVWIFGSCCIWISCTVVLLLPVPKLLDAPAEGEATGDDHSNNKESIGFIFGASVTGWFEEDGTEVLSSPVFEETGTGSASKKSIKLIVFTTLFCFAFPPASSTF